MKFGFYLPTQIHFGQGMINEVGKITGLYGKRALIVTGRSSARKLGFLHIMEEKLPREGIKPVFFEQVEPNPSVETVRKGANFFNKHRCEVIIALGGGSPLDAAKVIGILTRNPPPLSCYFGTGKVKNDIPPIIALPTTSGTGSEVTPYAVVTDTKDGNSLKQIIADPHIFPREALVDPALTLSLPPAITSDTGIDTLSHAVESFLSKKSFPLSEAVALRAVRITGKYLPRAVNHPQDMEARSQLMHASLLGGIAIAQTGATVLHAMGYPLISSFNLPHGRAIGILFPWFWKYSFQGKPEKFQTIITSLREDATQQQVKGAAESAFLLREFLHRAGLPASTGVKTQEKALSGFARDITENKKRMDRSPKKLSFQEVFTIYKKALLG